MNIRVLLVESQPDDATFLKDVLIEIEAGRHWTSFVSITTIEARTWIAAAAILASEHVDVMLLDLNLPDSRGIDTFRRSQTAAPHVPVILLMAPGADHDELAVRMLREGAQDFVIKKNADCASLAHAMRNAMERQRLVSSARAAAMTDPLTGLTNRSGFITLADRDRKLAERLGNRMMILLAKPMHLTEIAITFGDQRRDLTLVEAADHLRSVIGPTDIAARIAGDCFGLAIFETGVESLEEAWARMHSGAASHRVRVGAAIFDPDRPVSLDTLMERAASDLAPSVLAAQS